MQAAGGAKPQRIGLSATVRPIEVVADYLSPGASIVDVGHRREMDLSVEVPNDELGAVATSEMWAEIYDRIAAHISNHRTTLVFVNTRRMSERVAHALGGDGSARTSCCRITAACRERCGWMPKRASRRANCAPWSRRLRSNWASISERWIW